LFFSLCFVAYVFCSELESCPPQTEVAEPPQATKV
jgi:hypothetical protein